MSRACFPAEADWSHCGIHIMVNMLQAGLLDKGLLPNDMQGVLLEAGLPLHAPVHIENSNVSKHRCA